MSSTFCQELPLSKIVNTKWHHQSHDYVPVKTKYKLTQIVFCFMMCIIVNIVVFGIHTYCMQSYLYNF